jgi:hypothetical protein
MTLFGMPFLHGRLPRSVTTNRHSLREYGGKSRRFIEAIARHCALLRKIEPQSKRLTVTHLINTLTLLRIFH